MIHTKNEGMYDLRVHSLRKFFETQMETAGVNSDYIECIIGHKISAYHDVQALGVAKLRDAYVSAGRSIKPRMGLVVKGFARGLFEP